MRDTWLHEAAERAGMPLRSLDEVKTSLSAAKKHKTDISLARLMYRHGRLTAEALTYVTIEYWGRL